MKKYWKWIIFFLFSIILIKKVYNHLTMEHHIFYTVDSYQIEETFHKKDNYRYDMIISNKSGRYIYTIHRNLSKRKKVIQKIKKYQEGDLTCIVPFYQKGEEKNIYCNLGKQQVSIDYLRKSNNANFNLINEKIKEYSIPIPSSTDLKVEYENLTVYNENILLNYTYYLWNYKGLYVLEQEKNSYYSVLNYDLYDNVMSCVVDNYFVLFDNTSVQGIQQVFYYDSIKKKVKRMELKEKLSKDSYINGVVDSLIYITDRKNRKQYTLNIFKEQLLNIDKEKTYYVSYQKNKKIKLSRSDFFSKDHIFNSNTVETDSYIYYLENNRIYKYLKGYPKNPILLLQLENIKDWRILEDEVVLIQNEILYSYNDLKGLRKIVENNELNYNYKNIYQIGIKKN